MDDNRQRVRFRCTVWGARAQSESSEVLCGAGALAPRGWGAFAFRLNST